MCRVCSNVSSLLKLKISVSVLRFGLRSSLFSSPHLLPAVLKPFAQTHEQSRDQIRSSLHLTDMVSLRKLLKVLKQVIRLFMPTAQKQIIFPVTLPTEKFARG